ncbi:MAG: hypothetical protein KJZ73_13000 [Pseudorhodoplanes sp.]|nr:hypothetical protein [Pseudorhodoplanes sp.]
MRLVANWKAVLRYAWSVRLMVVAAILSGVETAIQLGGNFLGLPPGLFALLSAGATAAALIARFVAQHSLSGDA